MEESNKTVWDNLVITELGRGEKTPFWTTQTSEHGSHALARIGKSSWLPEKDPLAFLSYKHTSRSHLSFTVYHPCKDANPKVATVVLVVTGHRVCVHIRPVGWWVYRHTKRHFSVGVVEPCGPGRVHGVGLPWCCWPGAHSSSTSVVTWWGIASTRRGPAESSLRS